MRLLRRQVSLSGFSSRFYFVKTLYPTANLSLMVLLLLCWFSSDQTSPLPNMVPRLHIFRKLSFSIDNINTTLISLYICCHAKKKKVGNLGLKQSSTFIVTFIFWFLRMLFLSSRHLLFFLQSIFTTTETEWALLFFFLLVCKSSTELLRGFEETCFWCFFCLVEKSSVIILVNLLFFKTLRPILCYSLPLWEH